LTREDLRQLIDKTHFSMAQQDVRYYLNGLLLETERKTLRAVATDGHRLALSEITLGTAATRDEQLIVRARVCSSSADCSKARVTSRSRSARIIRVQIEGIRLLRS
jgi:DNA polymerase-3 subunit beta